MGEMRHQRPRVVGGDMAKEITLSRRGVCHRLIGNGGAGPWGIRHQPGIGEELAECCLPRGHQPLKRRRVRCRRHRWQFAIARLLQPQRRDRTVELAAQQRHLRIPVPRQKLDILDVPIIGGLADAGGAGLFRGFGRHPGGEFVGGGLGVGDGGLQRRRSACHVGDNSAIEGVHHQRAVAEFREGLALVCKGAAAESPQITSVAACQIGPGVGEIGRHRR